MPRSRASALFAPVRAATRHPAARATTLALAVALLVGPGSARAGSFASILVDDSVADWAGIAALHTDVSGDNPGILIDLGRIFVANDDRFVYMRFDVGQSFNLPRLPTPVRIYLDTDHSASTGYVIHGMGSDLMVECSGGGSGIRFYEQTAANAFAAQVGQAALEAYQGPTVAGTEFELRLKRSATLPIRAQAAFPVTSSGFRVAIDALNASNQVADAAPNGAASLDYTMATGSQPAPPANSLARQDPKDIRIMNWNVHQDGLFGSESARFTRVFQAVDPDVIAMQELYNTDPATVAARLDADLPLGGGAHWVAFKGPRAQITASRFPTTVDPGAPFLELATLIDLPNADYATDLYLIDSHLKCCGAIGTSEDSQRQASADAIIAWLRDLRTPGGAQLPANTPIVQTGDLNLVGGPQPLTTLLTGDIVDQVTYGPDSPPDWDGTDRAADRALHSDAFAVYSWRSDGSTFLPGKLDWMLITESAARVDNRFILNTLEMPPARLAAFGLQAEDTHLASDHMPLVVDILPGGSGQSGAPVPPPSFHLSVSPNPFRSELSLRVELPRAGVLDVDVFDLAGRRVKVLARGERSAGPHVLGWDGTDASGRRVESGIYVLKVRHEGGIALPRVTLVR